MWVWECVYFQNDGQYKKSLWQLIMNTIFWQWTWRLAKVNDKSQKRQQPLASSCFFIMTLVVYISNIQYQEPEKALFTFGVESMFAPEHLGGTFALLGYSYTPNSEKLINCFHKVHQNSLRFHINYHNGIPKRNALYSSKAAKLFIDFSGIWFKLSCLYLLIFIFKFSILNCLVH